MSNVHINNRAVSQERRIREEVLILDFLLFLAKLDKELISAQWTQIIDLKNAHAFQKRNIDHVQ